MTQQTVSGRPVPSASPLIKPGDAGDAVLAIQQKLLALGFISGTPDGGYGPITQQAVANFQQTAGLPATGMVDATTLHALGFEVDPQAHAAAAPANGTALLNIARQMFPDAPVQNIQTHLPLILQALDETHLNDRAMLLMALATIRAETGGFAPISEYVSKYNTPPGGHPYSLYDFRKDIGNNAAGDGDRYKGRGFVQLTGKSNYQHYSQLLGLGDRLVQLPDLANDPLIAARLLARFLKEHESVIRQALAKRDFAAARRAVNGGSHGLDAFTTAYTTGERAFA